MLSGEKSSVELNWNEVRDGFKQLLPISMFVVVFGIAFGLAAAQTGLDDGASQHAEDQCLHFAQIRRETGVGPLLRLRPGVLGPSGRADGHGLHYRSRLKPA